MKTFWLLLISNIAFAHPMEDLIRKEAERQNFDPDIAVSIATIESSLNPRAIGPKKEVGLFQILPKYSPVSTKKLLDPRVNARIGIMKLKHVQTYCPLQEDLTWIICFNNGFRRPNFPTLHPYYKRFMRVWAAR